MSLEPQTESIIATSLINVLLQAADEAIFTKSLTGIITSWSEGAHAVYGYRAEEIVGKPVTVLAPASRAQEIATLLQRARSGEVVSDFRTQRVTKSGELLELVITITPIIDENGTVSGALTIARNTSHMRNMMRTVRLLSERERENLLVLNAAQRVAVDILTSQTGTEALRNIADAARSLTGASFGALGVARSDGVAGLQEFITVGLSDVDETSIGSRPRGLGVLGLLLERTEPLRIDSLTEHSSAVGFPPNHPPMKSFLGVPIRSGEAVLGSLYLTNKEGGGPFTEADEVAVAALGSHAAVAIHNLLMLSRQRALVAGLIMAQEEERRAIAYDLHDGLTQYVMASHAHLEAFKKAHAAGNVAKADRDLATGLKYLKDAVLESRRLVNGLRTLALDDLGLAGALEQVVAEEGSRAGWTDVDFVHNIVGQRFDPSLETTAYRVAQEALTNARKHANAQRVRLALLLDDSCPELINAQRCLRLEVRDWGRGFDTEQFTNDHNRVGLHSMFERVRNLNGLWSLIGAPGEGTIVRAILPIVTPENATSDFVNQENIDI